MGLSGLRISENLSIEKHGKGEVLYSDRDQYCHGANLVYLSEPASNFTKETKRCLMYAPETLEALIEISIKLENVANSVGLKQSIITILDKNIVLIEEVAEMPWKEVKELYIC